MKTKDLLNEWKNFLNESRIIPLAELVDIIKSNEQYAERDVSEFTKFWNSNQFSSKYSQVIKNDLEKGEPIDHIVDAVTSHYNKVYQSAGPTIKSSIGDGSYTSDDLRKDLDERLGLNKFNKNEVRQQCQYQNERPVIGKYKDFDVIYSKSDWIVIEPKTISGSIAWAHGKPDGSEETDQARRVGWCTATSSGNNMFPNYAGNLHMFYLIKSDYDNISGPDRRLCLSFVKNSDGVKINYGDSTVDANNESLSEESINTHIGKNILNLIKKLVSGRKETSFAAIYSKITLSQLIRQINQMKSRGASDSNFGQELYNYALYAKSEEVVNYLITSFTENKELNYEIKSLVISRKDLANLSGGSIINKLLKDEDHNVRADLGFNTTSKEALKVLAKDRSTKVRIAVARNSNTPKELLAVLAKDEDVDTKIAIASNSNTPKELFSVLVKDENNRVRELLARNSNTPSEVLSILARDENKRVRSNVADNSGTPPEALLILAKDKDYIIKQTLLDNDSVTKEVLAVLAKDEYHVLRIDVADHSKTSKEVLADLARDENEWVRSKVASNRRSPKEVLADLARDENEWVRDSVARNKNTRKEVLAVLAKDENERVRDAVARNKNTPKEVLAVLAKDENERVALIANETLEMISEKFLRSYIKLIIS